MGFLFRTYRWLYIFSCQLTLICGKNLREGAGVLTEDGLKMFRKAWFCLGVELQRQIWNSFSLRFLISKGGLGNKMWLARGVFLWKPNSGCQLWFGWVGGFRGGIIIKANPCCDAVTEAELQQSRGQWRSCMCLGLKTARPIRRHWWWTRTYLWRKYPTASLIWSKTLQNLLH